MTTRLEQLQWAGGSLATWPNLIYTGFYARVTNYKPTGFSYPKHKALRWFVSPKIIEEVEKIPTENTYTADHTYYKL